MGTVITLTVLAIIKFGWAPVITAHLSTLPIVAGALWFSRKRKKKQRENQLLFHWSGFQTFYSCLIKRQLVWVRRKTGKGFTYQTDYKDWCVYIEPSIKGYKVQVRYKKTPIVNAIYDVSKDEMGEVHANGILMHTLNEQNEDLKSQIKLIKILEVLKKKEWLTEAIDMDNEEQVINTIIDTIQKERKELRIEIHRFLTIYIEGVKKERTFTPKQVRRRQELLQSLLTSVIQHQRDPHQFSLDALLKKMIEELQYVQANDKVKKSLCIPLEAWDKLEHNFKGWNKKEQYSYLDYKEKYLHLSNDITLTESEKLYLEHGWLKLSKYTGSSEHRLAAFLAHESADLMARPIPCWRPLAMPAL